MARKTKQRTTPPVCAIIGDGPTEKHYFDKLVEISGIKNIKIKPELPATSGKGQGPYGKVFNKAERLLADGYDHVHCLIDYDTIVQQRKQADFQKDRQQLQERYRDRLTVYINNPCFEVWILLHYERTGKHFSSCGDTEAALRQYRTDYCRQPHYISNLCTTLHPTIQTAITNAKALENNREDHSAYYPRAEVYKLIEAIFCSPQKQ